MGYRRLLSRHLKYGLLMLALLSKKWEQLQKCWWNVASCVRYKFWKSRVFWDSGTRQTSTEMTSFLLANVQDMKPILAYKCQHGVAPQYLQLYCESTSTCTGRRHLHSSQMRQLVVRTSTKYGDCSFAVQGPRVWNSLPVELRTPDISQHVFRNKLKTYLFNIR